MKWIGLWLVVLTGIAHATTTSTSTSTTSSSSTTIPIVCDSSVTLPAPRSRSGLYDCPAKLCNWHLCTNPNFTRVELNGCFQDGSCILTSAGSFDAALSAESRPCKQGTSIPGTCSQGDCWQDTSTGTLYLCTATNVWSGLATMAAGGALTGSYTNISASDTDYEFMIANTATTLVSVGCHCDLNCGTPAHLSFEDRALHAISLTGGGDLTCGTGTGTTSFTTFDTADTDRSLLQGEGAKFSVTNSPTASQRITLIVNYTQP